MRQHNDCRSRTGITDKPQTFDEGVDNILRILEETHETLLECNVMLQAIMEHLGVPYEPPAGFVKE